MSARKVGFDPTTVECCSTVQKTLRNDAVRDQRRVLAVAHDVARDQSLPWRKDASRREVASVEEGRDVERVAETMRVNDERVVLRRESW